MHLLLHVVGVMHLLLHVVFIISVITVASRGISRIYKSIMLHWFTRNVVTCLVSLRRLLDRRDDILQQFILNRFSVDVSIFEAKITNMVSFNTRWTLRSIDMIIDELLLINNRVLVHGLVVLNNRVLVHGLVVLDNRMPVHGLVVLDNRVLVHGLVVLNNRVLVHGLG